MQNGMGTSRVYWVGILILGASLFHWSCSDATNPIICTDIGCFSGLEVELLGTLPAEYRLTLGVPGSQEFFVDCTQESPCRPPIFIEDFLPETVRLTVSSGEQSWTMLATPEYEEVQPNGSQCPPTCRVGHVSLQVGS